ncbi:hypothetical protein [Clostridium butyricum]
MNSLMLLITLVFLFCLIGGLKHPELILWGDIKKRTKKKVILVYGSGALIFYILFGITMPDKENKTTITTEQETSKEEVKEETPSVEVTKEYNNFDNLKFGTLLEKYEDKEKGQIVIKAKIQPNLTDNMTIKQNGFNMEDFILNKGGDKYNEIQYWAVADMEDGTESKVISFTLDKEMITSIKEKKIVGNDIVDKAKDV